MSGRSFEQLEREVAALREALAGLEAQRERAWHRRALRQLTRPRVRFGLAALIVVVPLAALAVTVPNVFVNGTIADADDVNANFVALESAINLHEPDASAHHSKTTDAAELTSGTLADTRLSGNVSVLGSDISTGELDFDTATQLELDGHALLPSAHHVKTQDASELSVGTLADARLSTNVSLLGPSISTGELGFDTATQLELDSHEGAADAHHPVVPNRILVAGSGGDFTSIQAAIDSVSPVSASNPQEILIAPGTYEEKLTMKSHIRLLGTSREGTVLEAPDGVIDHVVLTSLEGVEISRLTLRNGGATAERALSLVTSELFLSDVRVEGYEIEFVRAQDFSVLEVERSEFLDLSFQQDRGVFVRSSQATITTSVFEAPDCAIEASTSALTLTNSEVLRQVCAYGTTTTPQPVVISHNRLVSVDIDGNVRAKIVGNQITGGLAGQVGGVRLDSSEPAQFVGNSLTASDTIPLSMTGDAEVLGNHIIATGPYDAVTNSAAASIVGNWISSSLDAVQDSGNARILGNTITAGGINESTNSLVMGNRVTTLPSAENWQNAGSIDIESTSDEVVLSAAGSTITLGSSGDITIEAGADLTLTGGGNVTITAGNELELNGVARVDVNGGMIDLN